jgi:hypothetical protein
LLVLEATVVAFAQLGAWQSARFVAQAASRLHERFAQTPRFAAGKRRTEARHSERSADAETTVLNELVELEVATSFASLFGGTFCLVDTTLNPKFATPGITRFHPPTSRRTKLINVAAHLDAHAATERGAALVSAYELHVNLAFFVGKSQ